VKDGIIKGDGTSRKMKATLPATYEEFKQAAEAGNQLLDILFNAAGWQQQPTLLNKENLGQDETMAVYNRGPEGTVDDLFQSVFAVGDIKVSTRTDLGDSWLLCNGEFFDENKYPDLPKVAPKKANVWNNKYTFSDTVDFVKYVNGYIFAKLKNNSLYYAKNPSGPWASVPHDNVLNLRDVGFFNGEYFLVNGGGAIFVSGSLDGPWEDVSGVTQLSRSYTSSVVAGGKLFVLTTTYGETTIDIFTSLHQDKVTSSNPYGALDVLVAIDGAVIAYNRSATSSSYICGNPGADTPTFQQSSIKFSGYNIVKSSGYTFYFSIDSTKLYRCLDIKQANIDTDTVAYKGSINTKMVYALGNLLMLGSPAIDQSLIIDSETFETFGNATTNPRLLNSIITQTGSNLIGISSNQIVWADSLIRPCTPVISIKNAYAYIRGK
jgi:hypothetical protein